MTNDLYILLGANLGDRLQTFAEARMLLFERVGPIVCQSALYETAPWGVTDQPSYLNQVLQLSTDLTPKMMLTQTQAIEQQLGRVRLEKWGSRIIDIDLLYYGQFILQSETLTLPHPLLHERRFTLVPLCEIAPDFLHPVLRQTNEQLLGKLADEGDVQTYAASPHF